MGPLPLGLLAVLEAGSPSVALVVWGPDGALEPAQGDRISRVLVIEGLTVVVGLSAERHCLGDCAVIQIRPGPAREVLELTAANSAGVVKSSIVFPQEASQVDRDRAIALRVIALVDELKRIPRRPSGPLPLAPQPSPAQPPPTPKPEAAPTFDPQPEPPRPEPQKARAPLVPAPSPPAPVTSRRPQDDGARLDLSFGAGPSLVIPLASLPVTAGLEVSLAGAFGPLELRGGGSWLAGVLGDGPAGRFRLVQLPFFAVITTRLPGLDFFRLGLGGELVAFSLTRLNAQSDVDEGVDAGVDLHLEARLPFRRFRAALTTRLSFHPVPYRALDDAGATVFSAPQFSFSVGLRVDLVLADTGAPP